jgi:hypothetical protein
MSGTVVIVIAALLGWFVLSAALALAVGRRLRSAPQVPPPRMQPASMPDSGRRDRLPAA